MTDLQHQHLATCLQQMESISLAEMTAIRLMNRTDCKYVTSIHKMLQLLDRARADYYCQEIEAKRIAAYRTVYFDQLDEHPLYRLHHAGHAPRFKVRVRTYEDSQLTFLEIKHKNNRGKTLKQRKKVASLHSVVRLHEGNDFLQRHIAYGLHHLSPAVGNRFHRITLVNKAKTERLTIDFDLLFDNFENHRQTPLSEVCVVELKRDGRTSSPIIQVLRDLRIQPLGFSKYLIGSALTNPLLRRNMVKPRLLSICKAAGIAPIALPTD